MKSTLVLLAASAAGLALAASSALAQDNDRYGDGSYRNAPQEEVEVIAPPYHARSSVTGAPIVNTALSQAVRYDDLDLRTDWGARALRDRIRATARDLCGRLDRLYPISTDDSPPCYRTALENAMYQADVAIGDARNGDEPQ